ncbi:MAG: tRNA pseudouridine(38-40) synthase TruA [Kiritimatiellae bacterium]|nr:tRNA pseudouridine(38-40) synthase TruA [Kiritimatiellia bacterium]
MSAAAQPRRLKVIVAYDGTHYAGWQVQPGKVTIQGTLEQALEALTHETIRIFCSGRTDTGVHAVGQVIHFDSRLDLAPWKWVRGINRYLPPEIQVTKVSRAKPDFDARFSAVGKEYRYFIWNAPVMPPHLRLYRAHVHKPLDLEAMKAAAALLQGTHDFAPFSANPGYNRGGTVRRLDRVSLTKKGYDLTLRVEGEGFMYRMVRSLAGYLIRVGLGEIPPEKTQDILRSGERTARVPTAHPQGLFLWRVKY